MGCAATAGIPVTPDRLTKWSWTKPLKQWSIIGFPAARIGSPDLLCIS
jgi:hypothetical protein